MRGVTKGRLVLPDGADEMDPAGGRGGLEDVERVGDGGLIGRERECRTQAAARILPTISRASIDVRRTAGACLRSLTNEHMSHSQSSGSMPSSTAPMHERCPEMVQFWHCRSEPSGSILRQSRHGLGGRMIFAGGGVSSRGWNVNGSASSNRFRLLLLRSSSPGAGAY